MTVELTDGQAERVREVIKNILHGRVPHSRVVKDVMHILTPPPTWEPNTVWEWTANLPAPGEGRIHIVPEDAHGGGKPHESWKYLGKLVREDKAEGRF